MKRYRIEHEISEEFRRVARKFQLEPQKLAQLLCEDFACRPPKELIIVSYGANPNLAQTSNGQNGKPRPNGGRTQWQNASVYIEPTGPAGEQVTAG